EADIEFLKEVATNITQTLESDADFTNNPRFLWFVQKTSIRASLTQGAELTGRYLGASASLAVLVSGFIIFVIMNRYVTEERKLIGVYHSFGLGRKEILYIYLGRAFLLGTAGSGLGAMISTILLYFIAGSIADLWGITRLEAVFVPEVIVVFMLLAIGSSAFFTFLPALQAARMTPYEALRQIRRIGVPKGKISRTVDKFPSFGKIAIRNLVRNRVRTYLTLFATIGAITLSIALLSAFSSVEGTINAYYQEKILFDARIEYYHPQNESFELSRVLNISGIHSAETSLIVLTNPLDDISEAVSIRGIFSNTSHVRLDILDQLVTYSGLGDNSSSNDALVSQRLAQRLNLTLGEDLTVRWILGGPSKTNLTLKMVGIVRDFEYAIGVYVGMPFLISNMIDRTNYFNIVTIKFGDNKDSIEGTQSNLSAVKFVTSKDKFQERTNGIVNSQIVVVSLTVLLGFMIAFVSVFNTQYISIVERDRESGIMNAFGYSKLWLSGEFLVETLLLVPPAIFVSFLLSRPVTEFFLGLIEETVIRIDYFVGLREFLFAVIFLIITIISGFVIIRHMISTRTLATILRTDE
ncbi:MAG TPA: FtsX-like permease family protein, partial [Candidatus Hodarchaeales archaeon]|nr:FtsX-like permease family protein [Candidatus Hodarchaeales archaeon]